MLEPLDPLQGTPDVHPSVDTHLPDLLNSPHQRDETILDGWGMELD